MRTGVDRVLAFAFLVLAVTTVVVALVPTHATIAALIAIRSVGNDLAFDHWIEESGDREA